MKYGQIRNLKHELLSDNWYTLEKVTFDYRREDGTWEEQIREVYDRGNGAAVLLYNPQTEKVLLTKQFRIPTYLNGNDDGMMLEVCAGVLEDKNPEVTIKKEIEEETGYHVMEVTKIFESYMSPGSVKEILHFYVAQYDENMKVSQGGGAADETENIEVLEYSFEDIKSMLKQNEFKDAKTIMLLQYGLLNGLI